MIRKATLSDVSFAARLASMLWPVHAPEERVQEFSSLISGDESAVFLAFSGEHPVGFAQCQLRHDYVEGTDSSPVGYLEGIYILPEHRNQGHARNLVRACERWAASVGCTEFASDCELTNEASLAFHLRLGFAEANRIICFTRKL